MPCHCTPLSHAVFAYEQLEDMHGSMMYAVAGEAAFEPFDDDLLNDCVTLVYQSSDAVAQLSPRARQARLNLIWKDFLAQQKQKRTVATPGNAL